MAAGGGEHEDRWLVCALRAAAASGLHGKALRTLQWQALEVSRTESNAPAHGDEIRVLEAALHRIQQAMDATERVSVLRAFSPHGKTVAGLLGRLSKMRNAKAHALSLRLSLELDVLLSGDVLGFGASASQGRGCAERARDSSTFSAAPAASTTLEESLRSDVVALHERDINELLRQRVPARLP